MIFPYVKQGGFPMQHLGYHQCLYYRQQGSFHSVRETQGDGEDLWWPGRGGWPVAMAGQPAVPGSVELSSLTPAGFFPPPTAFSSESSS